MIKCQNCGQEIPKESNFCPYCMKKFVQEQSCESVIWKKRNNVVLILGLGLLVVIGVIGIPLFFSDPQITIEDEKEQVAESDNNEDDKEINHKEELVLQPEACIGVWYDESSVNEAESPEKIGGYELIIYSIEDDEVLFSIYSYQAPPASRIAQAEYITATMDSNGKAEFQFDDDGWGNQGEGYLKLNKDVIEVSMNLTVPDETAMWSLKGTVFFIKSTDEIPDESIDFMGLIGRNYYDVRNVIGLREIGSEPSEDSGTYHYHEHNVRILEENGTICSVLVDYSSLDTYARENLRFSENINGNSTYEEIQSNMAEITYTNDYNGENITCFLTKETLFSTYLKVCYVEGKIQYIYYFVSTN